MAASTPYPFVVGGQTRVVSDSLATDAVFINAKKADGTGTGEITLSGSVNMSAADPGSNTKYGFTALTTGGGNRSVAVGQGALTSSVDDNNVAVGYHALFTATDTSNSVAVGEDCYEFVTAGLGNNSVAIGRQAMQNTVDGGSSVVIGTRAARASGAGNHCIAIGREALLNNTADSIVGIGRDALLTNSIGIRNTGVGYQAMRANSTANDCTALGYDALLIALGSSNTAIGATAGDSIIGGTGNTLLGAGAGNLLIAGNENICIRNVGVSADTNRTLIGTRATHDVIDLPPFRARPAPTASGLETGAQTLTIAQLRTEIIHSVPDGANTWTLPTAALVVAGLVGEKDNDCLDFYVINEDTGGTNDITLAPGTGGSIIGNTIVVSASVTSHTQLSSGHFRLRINSVAGPTYICYRLA